MKLEQDYNFQFVAASGFFLAAALISIPFTLTATDYSAGLLTGVLSLFSLGFFLSLQQYRFDFEKRVVHWNVGIRFLDKPKVIPFDQIDSVRTKQVGINQDSGTQQFYTAEICFRHNVIRTLEVSRDAKYAVVILEAKHFANALGCQVVEDESIQIMRRDLGEPV
ncbi:MAG: hypothetical protein K8R88_13210 [Armatimonadetes bacterium]|nr:hypothetical protein [Armatimonadota bacterium]